MPSFRPAIALRDRAAEHLAWAEVRSPAPDREDEVIAALGAAVSA